MLKLNRSFLLAVLFLLSYLSVPALSFAQGGNDLDSTAEDERDIRELEGQLNDFQKSQVQVIKDMTPQQVKLKEKLQKAVAAGDEKEIRAITQELAKTYKGANTAGHMKNMVNLALKQFQTMSEAQLRTHLLEHTSGNPVGVLLTNYPKTLDYLVKVLRDPLALPQFFSILAQKTKLMIFFGINVFLIVLNFLIKRAQVNTKASGGTHFKRRLLFFTLRLLLFIGFFHTEIGPFFFIAKDTFL